MKSQFIAGTGTFKALLTFFSTLTSRLSLPMPDSELQKIPVIFPVYACRGTGVFIKIIDRKCNQVVFFEKHRSSWIKNLTFENGNPLFEYALNKTLNRYGLEEITEAEYNVHFQAAVEEISFYYNQ